MGRRRINSWSSSPESDRSPDVASAPTFSPCFQHDRRHRQERARGVVPRVQGAFERWDPFISLQGEEYLRTFRTRMGEWRQDLGRALDVLTARPNIDATRIAYYGVSFGPSTAFPLVALEDRFKTAVLAPAGFAYREMPPEANAINYVSRATIPVLMLGGRHDYIFPLDTGAGAHVRAPRHAHCTEASCRLRRWAR
jgi:dienelactone hydrolase